MEIPDDLAAWFRRRKEEILNGDMRNWSLPEALPRSDGFEDFPPGLYPEMLSTPLPPEIKRVYARIKETKKGNAGEVFIWDGEKAGFKKEEIDDEKILLTDDLIEGRDMMERIAHQWYDNGVLRSSFIPVSILLSIHKNVKKQEWEKHVNYWFEQFNWLYVHE